MSEVAGEFGWRNRLDAAADELGEGIDVRAAPTQERLELGAAHTAAALLTLSPLKDPLPAGAKIVLSGKDRHGHALQTRFVKQ